MADLIEVCFTMFTFRLLAFSTTVTLILFILIAPYYILASLIISSLILVHLGGKLLARYWLLWWDCVLLLAEIVSGNELATLIHWWITLCVSTCLMLLLLLFNLGRGLWMLYSTKTGRWFMRMQHVDNVGPGSGRFHEALQRLAWALFGQYFLRKRFKFEKNSIRFIRGLSALCLLVIFVVVAYDFLVIRPFSDQSLRPIARYRDSGPQSLSTTFWIVSISGLPLAFHPTQGNISSAIQVYMNWEGAAPGLACPCIMDFYDPLYFNCSPILDSSPVFSGELAIAVNFTSALQAEKDAGGENAPPPRAGAFKIAFSLKSEYVPTLYDFGQTEHTWGHPFPLLPNVHLWATLAVTVEQSITNKKSAALGTSKFQTSYILNIDKLFPDPNPFIAGENVSSLRVFIPSDYRDLPGSDELVREIKQSTVFTGASVLGGLWTFMSGAFALTFGSSLLLVAFGLKPMSVYGLVHLLQGGRVSLAEGSILTDEEQIRTVAILREHLMDVGDPGAKDLAESSDVSNELEVIESQEGRMLERRNTDLEVGLQAVNTQHSGDVR